MKHFLHGLQKSLKLGLLNSASMFWNGKKMNLKKSRGEIKFQLTFKAKFIIHGLRIPLSQLMVETVEMYSECPNIWNSQYAPGLTLSSLGFTELLFLSDLNRVVSQP